MPDRYEIEIVNSSGDVVGGDNESSSGQSSAPSYKEQRDRQRLERQKAAEARRERQEARAVQRERDRQFDREERRERRRQRTRERAEMDVQAEIDSRLRGQIKSERALQAETNKTNTLRRRFINNLFGSVNRAHLGRRVNHGIDFVKSIISPDPRLFTAGTDNSTTTNNNNEGPSNTTRSHLTQSFLDQVFNTATESTRSQDKRKVDPRTPYQDIDIPGANPIDPSLGGRTANTNSSSTTNNYGGFDNPIPSFEHEDSAMPEYAQLVSSPSMVGGIFGRLGNAASQLTSQLGPLAAAAAPVAVGLASVVVPVAATTATFLALNAVTRRFMDTISDVPSLVTFAKTETELLLLTKRFERSERFGSQLATIERLQGERSGVSMDLVNEFVSPFLPLSIQLETLANRVLKMLMPVAKFAVDFTIEPVLEMLSAFVGFASNNLERAGEGIDLIVQAIEAIGPKWLGQAIRKYLNAKDPTNIGPEQLKDLFETFQLDSLLPKGLKTDDATTFEFGVPTL